MCDEDFDDPYIDDDGADNSPDDYDEDGCPMEESDL